MQFNSFHFHFSTNGAHKQVETLLYTLLKNAKLNFN